MAKYVFEWGGQQYEVQADSDQQRDAIFDQIRRENPAGPPVLNEQDTYSPSMLNEEMFAESPQFPDAVRAVPDGAPEVGIPNSREWQEPEMYRGEPIQDVRRRMEAELDTRSGLQRFREFMDGPVDMSTHGFMIGGDDELTRLLFPDDEAAALEERTAQFAQDNPGLAMGAEIAGGMAVGAGANRAGVTLLRTKTPTPLGMAVRGGAEGAAYGGGYGFLDTDGGFGERVKGAGQGATAGFVTGFPVGAVAGKIAGNAARRSADAVPTPEHVQVAKSQLYDMADQSGVVIAPDAVDTMAQQVAQRLAAEDIPGKLMPASVREALTLIETATEGPLPLRGFDALRQQVRDLATTPAEQRYMSIITREMDEFADGLTPSQVMAGDPAAAVAVLRQARAANVVAIKSELVQTAFYRAANAGQKTRQALQTQFRRIANGPDFDRFNTFEQQAILDIVRGKNVENALGVIGRLGGSNLYQAIRSGFGLIPAVANRAATKGIQGRSLALDAMVRNGGTLPMQPAADPMFDALIGGGSIGLMGQMPPLLPGY